MKLFIFIILFNFLICVNILIGQDFKISPLIAIPGDNYDFDILSTQSPNPYEPTFICWINELDTIYTVYLKEISPNDGDLVIIANDSTIKSNPQVAINRYAQGIKIAWQTFSHDQWHILYRDYQNDTLSKVIIISDSIQNDPQITMNIHRIAWNEAGKILVKDFYPQLGDAYVIDSIDCSSPELINEDYLTFSQILYEKGPTGSKQIFLGELNKSHSDDWTLTQLSQGINNINPRYGIEYGIAFQSYYNDVWKIIYTRYNLLDDTTGNRNFNYKNPMLFNYPIPTSSTNQGIPFFLIFDSDSSTQNINNVYIKTFDYEIEDSLISISNISGYNYEPDCAYLNYADSSLISILWIRKYNNKKEIWIAKDRFIPKWGSIQDKFSTLVKFSLKQNYPNPFNSTTTIEYYLSVPGIVQISVYNLLGEKIESLANTYKNAGIHKIIFDGKNYSSGLFFYELKTNYQTFKNSMLLIK